MFYQPLQRDAQLSSLQWQQVQQQLLQRGLSSIIVQWSQYGTNDFMSTESPLLQLLQAGEPAAQPVWLGLFAAQDEFSYVRHEDERRQFVMQQLARSKMLQQQLALSLPISDDRLQGWYLPLELHDIDFQTEADTNWLKAQLLTFVSSSIKPVAISAFSNGNLDAATFAARLGSLQQQGLVLWLQDGSGAGLMSAEHRLALLGRLSCHIGVIIEAFRQPDYGGSFNAVAAKQHDISQALAGIKPCHQRAYFSLRYLLQNPALLPLQD